MIDVAAVRSLADLYRREQSSGHCLDPDEAATTAVTHLLALGYRGPQPRRPDLLTPARGIVVPAVEPGPAGPPPSPAPAAACSMERPEVDTRREPVRAHAAAPPPALRPRGELPVPAQRG